MLKNLFLDFLFPIRCVGCKKEKYNICDSCLSACSIRDFQRCPSCGKPAEKGIFCSKVCKNGRAFDGVIAASDFHEKTPLADLIHRFKYDGAKEICSPLTELLHKISPHFPKNALITPVPLHIRRERHRGFNQSRLLASEISKRFCAPLADILERNRFTKPQVELSREKRLTNLRGAFCLKPGGAVDSEAVYFIVDDVCTTGSTLHECAAALKAAGARRTYGMVIAKTT